MSDSLSDEDLCDANDAGSLSDSESESSSSGQYTSRYGDVDLVIVRKNSAFQSFEYSAIRPGMNPSVRRKVINRYYKEKPLKISSTSFYLRKS